MDLNLRGFFTRDALIRYLKTLPALKTPVIDTVFTNRPNHPLPFVGEDMLKQIVRAMPVVRRGAASIPVTKDTSVTAMYEPLPIRPNVTVTGVELNNLKLLSQTSKEQWAQNKTDQIRRIVRATTEAIAAVSLSGSIIWPVQLDGGGWETWEINYGSPASITPEKLWDASNSGIKDVFETLDAMKEAIEDNGYGNIVYWAGKKAYSTLLVLAEAFKSTANMNVRVTEQGIDIAGFFVQRRSERHRNPKTGTMVPTVPDNEVKAISLDAGSIMPYCAVDDLDANLQAMPLFIKPLEMKDPSGVKLIGESKPFPIVNVDGIARAVVTS